MVLWNIQLQQMMAEREIEIGLNRARAERAKRDSQQQLEIDVQFVEQTNEGIKQTNARVLPVLKAICGVDVGVDREKWKSWWIDQLGDSPSLGESSARHPYKEDVTTLAGNADPAASATGQRALR